jgi:RNA polymerase sigma factor (sigma-70 family)
MPTGHTNRFLRLLAGAVLARDGAGLTDAQLLGLFVERREEAAFEALLRRHGPMVWGVCRRVLGNAADAEDAFQAAFLVLVRKAAAVSPREALGGWLYGVAYRTALEARKRRARRRTKEKQVEEVPQPAVGADDPWRELLPLLDHELNRLPNKYRVPVVLCELEGVTRREAARQLKIPEGTLSSRLAQARKLLAKRLARHGPALSGGAVAALLGQNAAPAGVPPSLLASTAKVGVAAAAGQALAAGAVPAGVLALTEGVVKAMLLSKLKVCWAVVLAVAVSAGAGLTYRALAQEAKPMEAGQAARDALPAARPSPDDLEALRKEVRALRERVQALETEVQALRPRGGRAVGAMGGSGGIGMAGGPMMPGGGGALRGRSAQQASAEGAADPLAGTEAAMKRLRQNPNDKEALAALQRVLEDEFGITHVTIQLERRVAGGVEVCADESCVVPTLERAGTR